MAYFKNIHSLAELKKEYRRLALENHPDKGGCIEFLGYTPETEALLEKERQEVIVAHQAWQAKQVQTA